MNKETFKILPNLNAQYCPHRDSRFRDFISCLEIYTQGHQHFDYTTHVSFTSPDDFANCQMGNILAAIGHESLVTTFSDLSSQLRSPNSTKKGFRIVYVEKKLRHSEDFERLCSCVRQTYRQEESNLPMVIIGRSGSIDHKILNRTISLYLPPFLNHVPPFSFGKACEKIKEAKELINAFWENHSGDVRDCFDKFERIDWLKNQDEVLWMPILAIAKAISKLSEDPSFLENIETLAKQLITSKKHLESSFYKEGGVLQATQAFIEEKKCIDGTDHFYRGDKLLAYVRKMLDRPRLTLSWISQILGDHHVIKDSYRDRFDVEDKERSKEKEIVKKSVQYHCYQFDEVKLKEAINYYVKGGNKDGD